jgi:transcriptional regulator with XRE-family HTH domain
MEPQTIVLELKRLGMTQAAIASAVRSSQATISDIENGKQRRPSYQMVVRLQALLDQKKSEEAAESSKSIDDVQVPTGGKSTRKRKGKA